MFKTKKTFAVVLSMLLILTLSLMPTIERVDAANSSTTASISKKDEFKKLYLEVQRKYLNDFSKYDLVSWLAFSEAVNPLGALMGTNHTDKEYEDGISKINSELAKLKFKDGRLVLGEAQEGNKDSKEEGEFNIKPLDEKSSYPASIPVEIKISFEEGAKVFFEVGDENIQITEKSKIYKGNSFFVMPKDQSKATTLYIKAKQVKNGEEKSIIKKVQFMRIGYRLYPQFFAKEPLVSQMLRVFEKDYMIGRSKSSNDKVIGAYNEGVRLLRQKRGSSFTMYEVATANLKAAIDDKGAKKPDYSKDGYYKIPTILKKANPADGVPTMAAGAFDRSIYLIKKGDKLYLDIMAKRMEVGGHPGHIEDLYMYPAGTKYAQIKDIEPIKSQEFQSYLDGDEQELKLFPIRHRIEVSNELKDGNLEEKLSPIFVAVKVDAHSGHLAKVSIHPDFEKGVSIKEDDQRLDYAKYYIETVEAITPKLPKEVQDTYKNVLKVVQNELKKPRANVLLLEQRLKFIEDKMKENVRASVEPIVKVDDKEIYDGIYTGESNVTEREVGVSLIVKNKQISVLEITKLNTGRAYFQNTYRGKSAREVIDSIVKSYIGQNYKKAFENVDSISGATQTIDSLRIAVKDALEKSTIVPSPKPSKDNILEDKEITWLKVPVNVKKEYENTDSMVNQAMSNMAHLRRTEKGFEVFLDFHKLQTGSIIGHLTDLFVFDKDESGSPSPSKVVKKVREEGLVGEDDFPSIFSFTLNEAKDRLKIQVYVDAMDYIAGGGTYVRGAGKQNAYLNFELKNAQKASKEEVEKYIVGKPVEEPLNIDKVVELIRNIKKYEYDLTKDESKKLEDELNLDISSLKTKSEVEDKVLKLTKLIEKLSPHIVIEEKSGAITARYTARTFKDKVKLTASEVIRKEGVLAKLRKAYNIEFKAVDTKKQPDKNEFVRISIDVGSDRVDKVFHMVDDKLEEVKFTQNNNLIKFNASSFSVYGYTVLNNKATVVKVDGRDKPTNKGNEPNKLSGNKGKTLVKASKRLPRTGVDNSVQIWFFVQGLLLGIGLIIIKKKRA